MNATPKKLSEQTIVLTGATSGIGLVTARRAAEEGARLVIAARNAEALETLSRELEAAGDRCAAVTADVADREQVARIAEAARERFGGFDTWVNNAGVSVYGPIDEVGLADARRVFDVNFWGTVHGATEALAHFRAAPGGGTIVNVGSVAADQALPLQSYYAASKHAVKAFTDALRMEVEKDGLPVNVTLIKPTTVDTPFFEHARNYMEEDPRGPDPAYAPDLVAGAILFAAGHPRRDIYVGGAARAIATGARVAPRFMDRFMEAIAFDQQKSYRPRDGDRESLYRPGRDLRERGGHPGWVRETSAYTRVSKHPLAASAVLLGAGALAAAALLGGSAARAGSTRRPAAPGRWGSGGAPPASPPAPRP